MSLKNFREILLRKCENSSLHNFIKYSKEELLTEAVLDSLQKMSDSDLKERSGLNNALLDFANKAKNDEDGVLPDMYHDAVSHHASHYKAALREGNQDVANKHARKIFDLVHLAQKIQGKSGGEISVSAPHAKAWVSHAFSTHTPQTLKETNEKRAEQGKGPIDKKPGDWITHPKSWTHPGKDFSFLQLEPNTHKSNKADVAKFAKNGHVGAYPMEEIRVNGKYLHIDDDIPQQDANRFTPHEFDSHPFISIGKKMGKATKEDIAKYFEKESNWHRENGDYEKWADRHMKMEEKDPEKYKARGSIQPSAIHAPAEHPLDPNNIEYLSHTGKMRDGKSHRVHSINGQPGDIAQQKQPEQPNMGAAQLMDHFKNTKGMNENVKAALLNRIKQDSAKTSDPAPAKAENKPAPKMDHEQLMNHLQGASGMDEKIKNSLMASLKAKTGENK